MSAGMKELLVQTWMFLFFASFPVALILGHAMKAGWIKESRILKSTILLLASFFLGTIIAVLFKNIYLLAIPPIAAIIKIVASWEDGIVDLDVGAYDSWEDSEFEISDHNPATGLPMVGGVDIDGNPYGCD